MNSEAGSPSGMWHSPHGSFRIRQKCQRNEPATCYGWLSGHFLVKSHWMISLMVISWLVMVIRNIWMELAALKLPGNLGRAVSNISFNYWYKWTNHGCQQFLSVVGWYCLLPDIKPLSSATSGGFSWLWTPIIKHWALCWQPGAEWNCNICPPHLHCMQRDKLFDRPHAWSVLGYHHVCQAILLGC